MSSENFYPDCPFCSKNEGDFFLESKHFAAVYNISPILPGHSLIIPKSHLESLFELENEDLAEFMQMGKKIARILSVLFQSDSFDFFIQEKPPAGQSIPHLHLHVVPRKKGDLEKPGDWYHEIRQNAVGGKDDQLSPDRLFEITQQLKNQAKKMNLKV